MDNRNRPRGRQLVRPEVAEGFKRSIGKGELVPGISRENIMVEPEPARPGMQEERDMREDPGLETRIREADARNRYLGGESGFVKFPEPEEKPLDEKAQRERELKLKALEELMKRRAF